MRSSTKYLVWILICIGDVNAKNPPPYTQVPGKVLLREVESITFRNSHFTTGRRSTPIQQINCVGGNQGCTSIPSTIQCTNKGTDGFDSQWECSAELDEQFKFGETNVVCEGYDYPNDPYILIGSCGVEYTLERTGARWKSTIDTDVSWHEHLISLSLFGGLIWALSSCCGGSPTYIRDRSTPGFWSGAAIGGLAGSSYGRRRHRTSGWGSGGRSRTARGYGGTRRR